MSVRIPARAAFVACLALVSAACSNEASAQPQGAAPRIELLVYAAASTRDALQALEHDYERAHAVDLVWNFGSSGDLAKQIVAAARADVFLSAGVEELDHVEAAQLVAPGTRRELLANQLVVVEPADAPSVFTSPFAPAQLGGEHVRQLSLANVESVPAGRYAKTWLEQTGVWPNVRARVLPGIDVRAALAAVASGAAQAGIVYRTDATSSQNVRIVHAVPVDDGPRITYPICVLAGRPHLAEAGAFVEFLGSAPARGVFERFGFLPASP
jgi:molybdate transport system substrate-binding protein